MSSKTSPHHCVLGAMAGLDESTFGDERERRIWMESYVIACEVARCWPWSGSRRPWRGSGTEASHCGPSESSGSSVGGTSPPCRICVAMA